MKRGKFFTLKLVSLGLLFHVWYMMSIFDIYFRTPVIHGMTPVPIENATAPAKRLVLFVGSSCHATLSSAPYRDIRHLTQKLAFLISLMLFLNGKLLL